jgi:hypothetical protein
MHNGEFWAENVHQVTQCWGAEDVLPLSCRAGCYCLQYSLKPQLPSGRSLRFSIDVEVTAGPPVGFDVQV